jgi:hypothetical protein
MGGSGATVELVCHGEFDLFPFWEYQDDDDAKVARLKNSNPGSAFVVLRGQHPRIKTRLEEFLDDLNKHESVIRKRKSKNA